MWEKVKKSFVINIFLLGVAMIVGYSAYNTVYQAYLLHGESQDAKERYEALLKKKAELEAYIAELENPKAIEREAKSRFNLKVAGEGVVVVVPEKASGDESRAEKSFFKKIKSLFVGN